MQAHALASKALAPGSGNRARAPNQLSAWLDHQGYSSPQSFRPRFSPDLSSATRLAARKRAPRLRDRRRPSSSAGAAGVTASGWRSGAHTGSPSRGRPTTRSSPTTTRERRSARRRSRASASCLPRDVSSLTVGSQAPFTVRDGIGQVWHLAAGEQAFGPGLRLQTTDVEQPQQLPAPVVFLPGASPLRLGGRPYRGQLQVSVANGFLRAVNSVGARGVPLRRRPVGDAVHVAPGGAEGTGRRCALLRARGPQDRIVVRPVPRHAEPGLPRHRRRESLDDRCRTGHRGPGRPLRRPTRHDLFLLVLRRADGIGERGLAGARVLPTWSRSTTRTTRSRRIIAGGRSPSPPDASARSSGLRDGCWTCAWPRGLRAASGR